MTEENMFLKKRKELGTTQNDMAIMCGVSLNTWVKWEKGVTFPSYKSVKTIRKVLELDL